MQRAGVTGVTGGGQWCCGRARAQRIRRAVGRHSAWLTVMTRRITRVRGFEFGFGFGLGFRFRAAASERL